MDFVRITIVWCYKQLSWPIHLGKFDLLLGGTNIYCHKDFDFASKAGSHFKPVESAGKICSNLEIFKAKSAGWIGLKLLYVYCIESELEIFWAYLNIHTGGDSKQQIQFVLSYTDVFLFIGTMRLKITLCVSWNL